MLNGNKFVPLLTGFHERHMQANFQFLGNHGISFVPCFDN
jgi:hypothetical protein